MKPNPLPHPLSKLASAFATIVLLTGTSLALAPNEWRASQTLDIAAPGLVRVNLPSPTLDSAQPGLDDVRIVDAAGNEVPYAVERPTPQPSLVLRPKEFRSAIENDGTKLTVQTGTTVPLNAVSLETPATEFIKAARVEGSHDGIDWQQLAEGQPLFRLPGGAARLSVAFPEGAWEFLRLTIDDRRAQPVPFTGAKLHTPRTPAPAEPVQVVIKSRDESPGVTRLSLDLGAANLTLASLHLETAEPLFTRSVTVAAPEVADDGIREQSLGGAVIYRVNIDGKNEERLEIPVEKQIRGRELLLLIHNQDSPPLAISSLGGERRVVRLVFFAREAGRYTLLSGNSQSATPRYDLPGLSEQLKGAASAEAQPSALATNPDYKAPEALGALALSGASIDVSGWKYRKPVTLRDSGVQQVELDLDLLARAQPDRRDLRLVRDDRQIPFLIERTSIARAIPLTGTVANDPKQKSLSRWSLKLPRAGLPVTRLVCSSDLPLFKREMRLWEEATDERGDKYPRELGRATWSRVPSRSADELAIQIKDRPVSDTLFLETENGDNPPIGLANFRCFHPVERLVFKAAPDAPVWLYYGNRDTGAPRYDVNLVANQLLRAERSTANAGSEENVASKIERAQEKLTGSSRYIFWGVLAVVVVALLGLVSRLLPKSE